MRDILEQLLRAADAPNPERAELLWAEYRAGAGSPDATAKAAADAAFATLLAWYGGPLYRRVWGFVRSDAADDVFQGVLARLHRERAKLATFGHALRWLRTVAVTQCVDAHRRETRRKARELARAVPAEGGTATATRLDLQEALRVALAKLSAREREAVALVYFEGVTRQDAAAAVGVHRDTFAKLLDGALTKLRAVLGTVAVGVTGTATVESALAATPTLPVTRLGELISAAGSRVVETGWSFVKVTGVFVGLAVCGAAMGGWALTRESERPAPTAPPSADAPGAPVESVSERNLRIFRAEVAPRQLAALKPLALEGGEVELVSVIALNTRVHCVYELRPRVAGPAPATRRTEFVHNTAGRQTHVYFDVSGTGEGRRVDPTRALVLGRNPLTGQDLVVKSEPLEEAVAAFRALPSDERTAAEARTDEPRLKRSLEPFLQRWYVCGDPSRGFNLQWLNGGVTFAAMSPTGAHFTHQASSVWVDPAGRAHGLPYTLGAATLSADGRRVEIDGSDEWWSREPVAGPKK